MYIANNACNYRHSIAISGNDFINFILFEACNHGRLTDEASGNYRREELITISISIRLHVALRETGRGKRRKERANSWEKWAGDR